jgi:ATP-binding cassette, subfamily F, member 3
MISLNGITKQYGGEPLFDAVSLRIGDRERLAIVGSNGAGKSTLMKIIMGLVEPDEGEIAQSRANTVGYLPQDGVHHAGRTLLDEAATAFDDLIALHTRMDELSHEITRVSAELGPEHDRLHTLVEELGDIQHILEHREGWNIESQIARVLSGLGFREADFGRMTDEFSGGWQMRIALAELLLREPTILLLDEPTNHLDIESLEWLEDYLRGYESSFVLISHDRRFLDNLVERTIEVTLGRLGEYSGNYSYYIEEKERRTAQLRAEHSNQQQQIKQTEQFIRRFRYQATKARQVQSRIKMLEKIDRIELEDEEGGIAFDFPPPPPPGRVLMELHGIAKAYGENEVFRGLDLTIERGDRIAFLGVNGAGKSTLARIIAGIEPFQEGQRAPGHNCIISYYAQNQADALEPRKTVLQTLDDVAVGDVRKRLRSLLGSFLFSGDDVFKQVSVLSGGEKSRLALAKMMLTPANLLVLDEPTNHLDIRSKTVLQAALARFEGSYIIVSHDRDFLEPLANRCIDFRDGRLRTTLGPVSMWLERRHAEQAGRGAGSALTSGMAGARRDTAGHELEKKSAQHVSRDRKREEAEQRQERYKKLKPLKNALTRVEQAIAALETEKADIEQRLAQEDSYRDEATARALTERYRAVQEDLAYKYVEWERVQGEIEEGERES